MIYATLDNFYLTDEQLSNSPSRQDGVDEATENQLRQFGCDLIQEAGLLLRLPQAVMATAQVLLHRFYCKKSLRKLDVKVATMAAFWLAAKLEEVIEIDSPTKLRLRDVLTVFYRIIRRREGRDLAVLDPYSKKYEEMKAETVRAERLMLRSFGFIVHVEQPHRFVLSYAHMLNWGREAMQEAWNIANDSLRTALCVRYRAQVVACGILFLAARRLKLRMPEDPAWWEAFEASTDQVHRVCAVLLELYSRPRAEYVPLGRDVTSRAALPGQASPKTANVTPMRSPLPEASLAVSGAVTEGGGGGGAVSEVRKGGSEGAAGGSAANGVDKDKSPQPSEGAAPSVKPAGAEQGEQQQPEQAEAQQQQSQPVPAKLGSQTLARSGRGRSRSCSGSREAEGRRSRSPGDRRDHREDKRRHRHRSRSRSRERERERERRDYDDRGRDGGRRDRDRDRDRGRERSHREDRERYRPPARR